MTARDADRDPRTAAASDWWKGAVIYEIYPLSFKDSNGDGLGDLPGVIENLDYVSSLGVDAIWVCPFFKTPMRDFGYDVADSCAVDPRFGTFDDIVRLIKKAHALGLKVLFDMVACHTSNEHPWFLESRASQSNPKSDWQGRKCVSFDLRYLRASEGSSSNRSSVAWTCVPSSRA